ncbi:hypothetical protein SEA_VERITY_81 [Gordonia phage Verity]|uniref:Uncharacterized protein n=2 Tax=Zitchvirus TaxID=2948963 RepID=A0A514DJ04_9CAUD|nr:hypothetical protein J1775_gp82 [Gordonia phage Zipp]YP_010002919.1 hypothetical protein J1776_gp81 [Gordonia phage Verity]QPO16925.1 hypothetical protein SEA_DELREY21_82 [Gordonia phage Delrey21]QXN74208.1 hypothetical protein SEA_DOCTORFROGGO_82 [Gordonia phage DoctorFroggo]QDH93235.1 hypothetical protein SEA_ZIPP_82 [Gordonia phage Zipp]QDH93567.1 hypothetical protein SEA_VERITY_81 [Gordonia phage Verity]
MIAIVGGVGTEYVRFTRCAECGKAIGDEVGQPGFGYWRHVVDDNSHHPKIPKFVGDRYDRNPAPSEAAPRCPAEHVGDRIIGGPEGGGRYKMRLRVLCELDEGHDSRHRSTFPDGTVWEWGETPVVPELVPAEVACAWCYAIYPDESHEPQCPTYGTLTPLENAITDVIRAHAFVPLHDRYAIARHLIAEGWRPRT